jgi:hypothetical protein
MPALLQMPHKDRNILNIRTVAVAKIYYFFRKLATAMLALVVGRL